MLITPGVYVLEDGEMTLFCCEECKNYASSEYNLDVRKLPVGGKHPDRCEQCGRRLSPYEVFLYGTTAPEAYDGFGTFTWCTVSEKDEYNRIVAISPAHLEWQLTRYGSGLYPATAI